MTGLVELGGVKGQTKAEGGAGVELGAVGKGSDTAVVDLDLLGIALVDWQRSISRSAPCSLPWRR